MFIARRWKTPKAMVALLVIEFPFTIATLTLFAIAQPNLYRTLLWRDGYENGFNSSPDELLYAYANHRSAKIAPVWSSFTTDFNVVISVLSMFVLLAKCTLYALHTWYPIVSALTHAVLVGLYAYSTYAQSSPDMADPQHPSKSPWFLRKSCHVVHTPSNYGYCEQAKASFAVTVCMVAMFAIYLVLAIYSSIPTKDERLARTADVEQMNMVEYSPESTASTEQHWEKQQSQGYLQPPRSAVTPGLRSPMTPRTVAFQALQGMEGKLHSSASQTRPLPFREQYQGPDGR